MAVVTIANSSNRMSLKEVCEEAGICRITLWAWIKNGRFPPALPLWRHKKYWNRKQVEKALRGEDWE